MSKVVHFRFDRSRPENAGVNQKNMKLVAGRRAGYLVVDPRGKPVVPVVFFCYETAAEVTGRVVSRKWWETHHGKRIQDKDNKTHGLSGRDNYI